MSPGPSAPAAAPAVGASARGLSRNPEGAIREACAWPDPAPPISLGPPASSPASSMTARRPVIPELPYPGCAGVPPASREARHAAAPRPANPAIANPQSRIRAPRRRAAPPGYPGTPLSRVRGRPARLARSATRSRLASRKSRKCEPAIPDPGAPPARRPARLSRNSRIAPVPDARLPRVPQIPQLPIRNPGSGRRAGHGPASMKIPACRRDARGQRTPARCWKPDERQRASPIRRRGPAGTASPP